MAEVRTRYFDHAATTAMRPEVLARYVEVARGVLGNPSSFHQLGREAKKVLDQSREEAAEALDVVPAEVYFTSGGTEADNWAIFGLAEAGKAKGRHFVTSALEHHAVLHPAKRLEKQGYRVTYLSGDREGRISPEQLKAALLPQTSFVSIMAVNNEVGTVQDVPALARIAQEAGLAFHTDAVQAFPGTELDFSDEAISLASLSAHKLGGPKGCGALIMRRGQRLANLMEGGGQERMRRPGTEDVAAIAAFARALQLAKQEKKEQQLKLLELRQRCLEQLQVKIPGFIYNGSEKHFAPHILNVSLPPIEGETLLLLLDGLGFCCSSGSACTSGSLDPSHVLLAMGKGEELARSALRISFSAENTFEEVEDLVTAIAALYERLVTMRHRFTRE